MFVDGSAMPDGSAGHFTGPVLNSDGHNPNDDQVDPPECAPIFSGPAHAQKGTVLWSMPTDGSSADTTGQDFIVLLAVPAGQPDPQGLRDLLGKCGTSQSGGLTSTMSPPIQHPGLPNSAVAWRWSAQDPDIGGSAGAEIIGLSRGLYVEVSTFQTNGGEISPGDIDILVKIFNDQVRKLEAA